MLEEIPSSVTATLKSSTLKLDPEASTRGVFLAFYHINDADEGEPRTVEGQVDIRKPIEAPTTLYGPTNVGHYSNLGL